MKLKRIIVVILALSTLCFLPSCGSDNAISETTSSIEDVTEFVPFYDITFYMKKSWDYECKREQNEIYITCSDGSFLEAEATIVGRDQTEEELKVFYDDLKRDREVTELAKFDDCDIYYYTYKPKTVEGTVHAYYFAYKGTSYYIQICQKNGSDNGIVYNNSDHIMKQIKQSMIDYKKVK